MLSALWVRARVTREYDVQRKLANYYMQAGATPQNKQLAFYWMGEAASHGDPDTATAFGMFYLLGYGIEPNAKLAVRLFRGAAATGFAPALYELGRCFAQGDGVERSILRALACFTRAAEGGNRHAMEELAARLSWDPDAESLHDPVAAVHWAEAAARAGSPEIALELGRWCLGSRRAWPVNPEEAESWLLLAYDRGVVRAAQFLAALALRGGDTHQAAGWFVGAIAGGSAKGLRYLTALVLEGRGDASMLAYALERRGNGGNLIPDTDVALARRAVAGTLSAGSQEGRRLMVDWAYFNARVVRDGERAMAILTQVTPHDDTYVYGTAATLLLGEAGSPYDPAASFMWLERALAKAPLFERPALAYLQACRHATGLGAPRDPEQAQASLSVALTQQARKGQLNGRYAQLQGDLLLCLNGPNAGARASFWYRLAMARPKEVATRSTFWRLGLVHRFGDEAAGFAGAAAAWWRQGTRYGEPLSLVASAILAVERAPGAMGLKTARGLLERAERAIAVWPTPGGPVVATPQPFVPPVWHARAWGPWASWLAAADARFGLEVSMLETIRDRDLGLTPEQFDDGRARVYLEQAIAEVRARLT